METYTYFEIHNGTCDHCGRSGKVETEIEVEFDMKTKRSEETPLKSLCGGCRND